MCLIQCLHWIVLLVLKKGERTLLPFVSFPLSPSLLSTSPVADCISVVFSRTLWNYSLHPSPVHLTRLFSTGSFSHSEIPADLYYAAQTSCVSGAWSCDHLPCVPTLLGLLSFRCILDILPCSLGRNTSPPSSSSSSHAWSPPGEEPGVSGWSRLHCGSPNPSELVVPAGLLCSFPPELPWITLRHNIH